LFTRRQTVRLGANELAVLLNLCVQVFDYEFIFQTDKA